MRINSGLLQNLVSDLGRLASILQNAKLDQRIVITMGIGLQEGPLPLRFLSYVVAIMRLLKLVPSAANIQAELFVALETCLLANPHYEREKIVARAQQTKKLLELYINTFYPEQAARVSILLDRAIEPGSEVDEYFDFLMGHARVIADSDERIRKFVAARGGETALRYASLHPLQLRSPLKGAPAFNGNLIRDATWGMAIVLVFGGRAEHIFAHLQQKLEERIGTHEEWCSYRVFTPIGSPPTYHLQENELVWEEPELPKSVVELIRHKVVRLSEINALPATIENLLRDLLTLLLDCSGIPNFASLPNCLASAKSGLEFEANSLEHLETGWQRLRELF